MTTEQEWATQLKKDKLQSQTIGSIDVDQELGLIANQIEYQKIKLQQAIEMNDPVSVQGIRSALISLRANQARLEILAEKQTYPTVSKKAKDRILRAFYTDVAKLIRFIERRKN